VIEITTLASATGPLTKRISLSPEGKLISDGSACVMGSGYARRNRLSGVAEFAGLIGRLDTTQAIALGSLRSDLPDDVQITTAMNLAKLNGSAPPDLIARTAGHIAYAPGAQAFALLDYDTKGMPSAVRGRLDTLGGFWPALLSVAPDFASGARVVRRSTSSGIARSDTGEMLPGSDGVHVFILIKDGSDTERFLKTLHDRCWLAGLGWMMVGAGGQFLERSIVDRMVYAAERLVFEGLAFRPAPGSVWRSLSGRSSASAVACCCRTWLLNLTLRTWPDAQSATCSPILRGSSERHWRIHSRESLMADARPKLCSGPMVQSGSTASRMDDLRMS
jgi:hypothetical protein